MEGKNPGAARNLEKPGSRIITGSSGIILAHRTPAGFTRAWTSRQKKPPLQAKKPAGEVGVSFLFTGQEVIFRL
jgi:hypothetical protein